VQSPATDASAVITSQPFAEELRAALRSLRNLTRTVLQLAELAWRSIRS
jgi:uncharacterized protein YjiS (DUF1127 family)